MRALMVLNIGYSSCIVEGSWGLGIRKPTVLRVLPFYPLSKGSVGFRGVGFIVRLETLQTAFTMRVSKKAPQGLLKGFPEERFSAFLVCGIYGVYGASGVYHSGLRV